MKNKVLQAITTDVDSASYEILPRNLNGSNNKYYNSEELAAFLGISTSFLAKLAAGYTFLKVGPN